MEKSTKIIVGIVVAVILLYGMLVAFRVLPLPFQAAIQTQGGTVECNSYAQCSTLLTAQGYTKDQIDRLLTVCDASGCRMAYS